MVHKISRSMSEYKIEEQTYKINQLSYVQRLNFSVVTNSLNILNSEYLRCLKAPSLFLTKVLCVYVELKIIYYCTFYRRTDHLLQCTSLPRFIAG